MTMIIDVQGLSTRFGAQVLHENLSFQVEAGEIIAIVGGSGSGKTTLLREMIMLERPAAGSIALFGHDIWKEKNEAVRKQIRQRCGVMFQGGALFSGLTVLENVCFPLRELTTLPDDLIREIGLLKIHLALLPPEAADLLPAELSGGMIKRAAVARSLAMDPELLFLDEPTAGLDPLSASEFDELMLTLRANLGLTIVIITHDMDTLARVPDRVAFLGRKQVLAIEPLPVLMKHSDPLIQAYFNTPRARATIEHPHPTITE